MWSQPGACDCRWHEIRLKLNWGKCVVVTAENEKPHLIMRLYNRIKFRNSGSHAHLLVSSWMNSRPVLLLATAAFKATFLGNAPCGVYKYKLPRAVRTESSVGTKVFFFKAFLSDKGPPAAADAPFLWLKKSELQSYLKPAYMMKVERFVLDLWRTEGRIETLMIRRRRGSQSYFVQHLPVCEKFYMLFQCINKLFFHTNCAHLWPALHAISTTVCVIMSALKIGLAEKKILANYCKVICSCFLSWGTTICWG